MLTLQLLLCCCQSHRQLCTFDYQTTMPHGVRNSVFEITYFNYYRAREAKQQRP